MKKIKIGVIGVGAISSMHIKAYLRNPHAELYAFCDIDNEILKEAGDTYNIEKLYTDCKEMLKLEELDAVSICTWNSAHASCAISALNAGKHVLCEKPMSTNAEEAMLMNEAAKKNNKLLMMGFVRRFGNDTKILNDFILADYFGEMYYAKASYLRRYGNPEGWFSDKSRSGGGPLIDLGVHVIDFLRYIMGNPNPVSVYGMAFKKLNNRKNIKYIKPYVSKSAKENDIYDVEDLASAMIRFDNGALVSVEASFDLHIKEDKTDVQLFGTKGGAVIAPNFELYTDNLGYLTNTSFTGNTGFNFEEAFSNEINHFISCVKGEEKCISPAIDGVIVMKILDAIYKSAKTGHEVII